MAWLRKTAQAAPVAGDSVLGTPAAGGRAVRHITPRRWSIGGALLGILVAFIAFAPASWLARALASATEQHLLIVDTRGSIWNGSGVLVLTGGAGSRDALALPGRLHWRMSLKGMGLQLAARQDCCINGELLLGIQPGLGRMAISVDNKADWLARLPAGVLAGLGTPWNTLQLGAPCACPPATCGWSPCKAAGANSANCSSTWPTCPRASPPSRRWAATASP